MHFSKHLADSLPAQKSRQTLHSSSDISSKYHVHKQGFARFLLRFGVHILSPRWLSSEGYGSYKDQLSTLSDLYGTVFFLATPCALNLTLPSFWKAHFQRVLWKHTPIQSSLLSSQTCLCAFKCLCLLYAKCVYSIIFQAPGSRDLIIYSF